MNPSQSDQQPTDRVTQGLIPPLESRDRLWCHEFERRYAANPHIKKAELIEGVVYVASPLRFVKPRPTPCTVDRLARNLQNC